MKLVNYEIMTDVGPFRRIGALVGQDQRVVDIIGAYSLEANRHNGAKAWGARFIPTDMVEFITEGKALLDPAAEAVRALQNVEPGEATGPQGEQLVFSREKVKLLAPIPRPPTIRAFSTSEEHLAEQGPKVAGFYRNPAAWKIVPTSVIGPEDPIPYPYFTQKLDLELELGFVVGRVARDVAVEKGKDFIAGYTIFVDCCNRDRAPFEQLGRSKSHDICSVVGPCLVTPDEFNERDARVWYRVNGKTWYEGNTGTRRSYYSEEILAYSSDSETLYPGELMSTGTIGRASSADLGQWVKPGDKIEMGIEGIGAIKTTVVQQAMKVDYALNGMKGHVKPAPGYPSRED